MPIGFEFPHLQVAFKGRALGCSIVHFQNGGSCEIHPCSREKKGVFTLGWCLSWLTGWVGPVLSRAGKECVARGGGGGGGGGVKTSSIPLSLDPLFQRQGHRRRRSSVRLETEQELLFNLLAEMAAPSVAKRCQLMNWIRSLVVTCGSRCQNERT